MIAAWMLVAPLDWSFFPGQCWPLLSPVHKVIRTKLRVYLVWIECGTLAQLPWEPFPSDCTLGLNEKSCLLAPVWWRTAVPSCQYLCWRLTASAFLPAVTPALTPPTHTPGLTGLVCVRSSLITKLPQLAQASWLVGQKKNPSELSLSLSLFFSVFLCLSFLCVCTLSLFTIFPKAVYSPAFVWSCVDQLLYYSSSVISVKSVETWQWLTAMFPHCHVMHSLWYMNCRKVAVAYGYSVVPYRSF